MTKCGTTVAQILEELAKEKKKDTKQKGEKNIDLRKLTKRIYISQSVYIFHLRSCTEV